MIRIKRVYDPPDPADGARILAERLWPRGVKKEALKLDAWAREAAPSTELRKWFKHDPSKWEEFTDRYRAELDAHPEAWLPVIAAARKGRVTLLFSSHDEEHNNVAALKAYIESKLSGK